MRRLAKILITASALSILPLTLACAADSTSGSQILNGQVNFNTALSTLNTSVYSVQGDYAGTSTAGANAVDITTMNDTTVDNSQYSKSVNINSTINAGVGNVSGSVGLQSQTFCNSASVSTDPTMTAVKNYQECNSLDPSSTVNANIANVGGNAAIASSSVGNTLQADSNALNMPIQTNQINASLVQSKVNANIANVGGSVSTTSAAIGNNAQIVHYSTAN